MTRTTNQLMIVQPPLPEPRCTARKDVAINSRRRKKTVSRERFRSSKTISLTECGFCSRVAGGSTGAAGLNRRGPAANRPGRANRRGDPARTQGGMEAVRSRLRDPKRDTLIWGCTSSPLAPIN